MTRLILIRHGETDYGLQHKYCGFSNPPLNNNGIYQSEKLAAKLKGIEIDKVYSSDLKRAYESTSIIFKDNPIEKIVNFREMNFGILEGLRYEEILQKHPEIYKDWINNPLKVRIPNGESLRDLSKRVKERLSFILARHRDEIIAVVTHAGPIRVILCDILNYSLKDFWRIEQDVAAYNIIDYSGKLEPRVIKMNDTSCLSIKEEITL